MADGNLNSALKQILGLHECLVVLINNSALERFSKDACDPVDSFLGEHNRQEIPHYSFKLGDK